MSAQVMVCAVRLWSEPALTERQRVHYAACVWGLGLRVCTQVMVRAPSDEGWGRAARHGVSGFGLWVQGFGLRVSGFGVRVSGFGVWVQGFGFPGLGFGFRIYAGCRVQGVGMRGRTSDAFGEGQPVALHQDRDVFGSIQGPLSSDVARNRNARPGIRTRRFQSPGESREIRLSCPLLARKR